MFSSLPMYDFEHLNEAWDIFYAYFYEEAQHCGLNPPEKLTRGEKALNWGGGVFLSMTCGAPFRNQYHQDLEIVGTLDFGLIADRPGYYFSWILGKVSSKRRTILAVNDLGSQSGFHAVIPMLQEAGVEFEIHLSGSHEASIRALAKGNVDLCGVDAQSWHYIVQADPCLAQLPQWKMSKPSPGLPLVTAGTKNKKKIKQSLQSAVETLPEAIKKQLGISGLTNIDRKAYLSVPNANFAGVIVPTMD